MTKPMQIKQYDGSAYTILWPETNISSVKELGPNVEAFLKDPTSAKLATAITGETGSGALVFGTNPVLATPYFSNFKQSSSANTTLLVPTYTPLSANPSATGASGATNIIVSSAANIITGMNVSGTGIGTGAIVTNINGTTITLSVQNSGPVSGTVQFIDQTNLTLISAPTSGATQGQLLQYNTNGRPSWISPSNLTADKANDLASGAAGDLPYQLGPNNTVFLNIGTNGQILSSNGTAPIWISQANMVVGTATTATTAATATTAGKWTTARTVTFSGGDVIGTFTIDGNNDLSGIGLSYSNTVPLEKGGTGATTKAVAFNNLSPIANVGDLIYGNAANSSTRLPIGGNNTVLTSNGTVPTWSSTTGSGSLVRATGATVAFGVGNVTSPSITFSGDTNTGIYQMADGQMGFSSNGVNALAIGNATIDFNKIAVFNNGASASSIQFEDGSATAPSISFANDTNTGIYRRGSNNMAFTAGGSVPLYIKYGNTLYANTPIAEFGFDSITSFQGAVETSTSPSDKKISFTRTNGTQNTVEVGSIVVNYGSISVNGTSDYRLKEDLKLYDKALDKIISIPIYTFNWKDDPIKIKTIGFLAHELQNYVPEAVTGEKDAIDKNGNPVYQQIDQSKLIPLLVKSIQELNNKIKQLEDKINV